MSSCSACVVDDADRPKRIRQIERCFPIERHRAVDSRNDNGIQRAISSSIFHNPGLPLCRTIWELDGGCAAARIDRIVSKACRDACKAVAYICDCGQ